MSDYLAVQGEDIVLRGKPILLKGAGLGGWMNMENFITGFPGHEHQMRAALLGVLGREKYELFFDTFLEAFFGEEDAAFFASLGLNCLRIPVNYRHFEDDMNPRVFKEEGLKHLDRVIDLCAKHGIYTVIDLHTAPGGQNVDWHSDAGGHQALFWDHKDFQDRAILIWEHLARHYKNNTWVAGYNPLNEPTDSQHVRLLDFYVRVEKAIRAVDPDHMLFFDGNTFGYDFSHFKEPLPNSVYACHDYSRYGFPNPPSEYAGTPEQNLWHQKSFNRKIAYMREHKLPRWNGEFGPVYSSPDDGPNYEQVNAQRYQVLKYQLGLYANANTSWSIWTYKDIGFQGMVYVNPETSYMRLLASFFKKKKLYATDEWGCDDAHLRDLFRPIEDWIVSGAPSIANRYPPTWKPDIHVARLLRNILLSEEMCYEYANYFAGKSSEELLDLAKSFAFDSCVKREELNAILMADTVTS